MELEERIRAAAEFSFTRSGGPGGQNVNKLNTQAEVRILLENLELQPQDIERLRHRLGGRITGEGYFLVRSSETRSQYHNRHLAMERAVQLILKALTPERPRKKTRPSKSAVQRRLNAKKQIGVKKAQRQAPETDDT